MYYLNVLELFAGVGGFRLGLEAVDSDFYKTVMANQWEPSKKRQDAFNVYNKQFPGSLNLNIPIQDIDDTYFKDTPIHMIVGGFPCFVAGTLVLTDKGYQPIETITQGTLVLTHTNTYKKVKVSMKKLQADNIYQLETYQSPTTYLTAEHPVYVRTKLQNGELSTPEWVEAQNLTTNHLVGIPSNHQGHSLYDYTKEDVNILKEGEFYWKPLIKLSKSGIVEDVYNLEVETDHSYVVHDMIVHNCQSYSVAATSNNSLGIEGEKGVLFWDIVRLTEITQPNYLVLENVDRLLKSPSKQRGRDFAIMLAVFNKLGYTVEWQVIQSDLLGYPQRRKRVFIIAHKHEPKDYFARVAPSQPSPKNRQATYQLSDDIASISDTFSGQFYNKGMAKDFNVTTEEVDIIPQDGRVLRDILEPSDVIDDKYFFTDKQVERLTYLRGAKSFERVTKDGHKYTYSEGAIRPVDYDYLPSRTLLTGEGNISRTTHVIDDDRGWRRLTPIECERLNGFPDNWTEGITDSMRYFTMGNALVVGIIQRIGEVIKDDVTNSQKERGI